MTIEERRAIRSLIADMDEAVVKMGLNARSESDLDALRSQEAIGLLRRYLSVDSSLSPLQIADAALTLFRERAGLKDTLRTRDGRIVELTRQVSEAKASRDVAHEEADTLRKEPEYLRGLLQVAHAERDALRERNELLADTVARLEEQKAATLKLWGYGPDNY